MECNTEEKEYNEISRVIAVNLLDTLNIELIADKCEIPLKEVKMFEKAYDKGKKEIKLEIAKKLIGILSIDMIAKKCSLDLEEVKKLREEYELNK